MRPLSPRRARFRSPGMKALAYMYREMEMRLSDPNHTEPVERFTYDMEEMYTLWTSGEHEQFYDRLHLAARQYDMPYALSSWTDIGLTEDE